MVYYLLNSELEILDGIEIFQSMIWTEKYYEVGDFELYLPATPQSLTLYTEAAKNHYLIIRADDAVQTPRNIPAMIVEKVQLDDTYGNGDMLIITGHQVKNILSYRLVLNGRKEIAGDIQDEIFAIVRENCILSNNDRILPRLELGKKVDLKTDDTFINYDTQGKLVSTVIETVCKDKKIGWDITVDFYNKKLVFGLYKGTDRSTSQEGPVETKNAMIVFSTDYNNLIRTTYTMDTYNYRNVAYAESEYNKRNEDTNQMDKKTMTVEVRPYKLDTNPVGFFRNELYVDSKTSNNSDTETDVAALRSLLETAGRTKLEEYKSKIAIDGEVAHDLSHTYGKDYFMGDLVTIQNEYGHSYDGRVTAVTINLAVNKNSVIPAFTIENYTGKEEDDTQKIPDSERRMSEDGQIRVCENGANRQLVTGYIYRDRIDEDGNIRLDSAGHERSVTKSEYFDDEKYGIPVRR